jgi:hypothetical protein
VAWVPLVTVNDKEVDMRASLIGRFVVGALLLGVGASAMVAWQGMPAQATQLDGRGLESCLVPKHKLTLPGSEAIDVEIVALSLVGHSPALGTIPITVVPQGAIVPGHPPDATLTTPLGDAFDVHLETSLTDLAGVAGIVLCNCIGNLCRGLDCPSGAGLCRRTADCF